MYDRADGKQVDQTKLQQRIGSATAEVVRRQIECGIDVINDGEFPKVGYSTYVTDRLTGFDGASEQIATAEMQDFPEYWQRLFGEPAMEGFTHLKTPACTGPIKLKDPTAVQRDVANFKAALKGVQPQDMFMTAASPGVISVFLNNRHYPSEEAYLAAIAEAMKPEYEAIANAGFVLQVDCPDLAMSRQMGPMAAQDMTHFRRWLGMHVEALNQALANVPADRLRMHICWGNYEGPHVRDVPLRDIVDIILTAKPSAISIEASNPRHAHEWKIFEDVKLPPGKMLIPGVIDSTTNFVEHPELVAQRILNYAKLVGRENVMAGTDCGFGTFVGLYTVEPKVTWRKFESLAEGARLASAELWGQAAGRRTREEVREGTRSEMA
ncbi:MAG: cobalamin-independent methionine synthase II family protein, partial [Chloroflexota bacterium]|nr:cobalamin-independent methionine synthase II family protein [Chloroflexota bacterium]